MGSGEARWSKMEDIPWFYRQYVFFFVELIHSSLDIFSYCLRMSTVVFFWFGMNRATMCVKICTTSVKYLVHWFDTCYFDDVWFVLCFLDEENKSYNCMCPPSFPVMAILILCIYTPCKMNLNQIYMLWQWIVTNERTMFLKRGISEHPPSRNWSYWSWIKPLMCFQLHDLSLDLNAVRFWFYLLMRILVVSLAKVDWIDKPLKVLPTLKWSNTFLTMKLHERKSPALGWLDLTFSLSLFEML